MYKEFNFDYDPSVFLKIFNENAKDESASPFAKTLFPIHQDPYLELFYQQFNFIPTDRRSLEIMEVKKRVGPYVSPGNNGTIIFPLSGALEYNFYSYVPTTVENGRPILKPGTADLRTVEPTLTETIKVTRPIAINGLKTHMYRPVESPTIIFVLKIPLNVSWEQVSQGI